MKIKFISLASGSSGNCYFLGTDRYGILVDAGIGIRTIKKTLKELGIGLDIIRAVFITHDHADHIKAVGHLGEKFGIPVYSTPEVHAGINKSYCMTEKLSTCVHYLHKGETMELEDFTITAFEVPKFFCLSHPAHHRSSWLDNSRRLRSPACRTPCT